MVKSLSRPVSTGRPMPTPAAAPAKSWRLVLVILCSLVILTFVAFLPALNCGFINYDDGNIIVNNSYVRDGLTSDGLHWAWTLPRIGYPQPVTLTTLMFDADVHGIDNPGAFHAT